MEREIGLWIDHRKALIVIIGAEGQEVREITSHMEKHVRFSGNGAQDGSSEDQRDRQFWGHLDGYYDRVIDIIHDGDSIHIFGPGEAKGELVKRLKSKRPSGRIVTVETVDKMTDNQIAAKVRGAFAEK